MKQLQQGFQASEDLHSEDSIHKGWLQGTESEVPGADEILRADWKAQALLYHAHDEYVDL